MTGSPINKYEFYIAEKPVVSLKSEHIMRRRKKSKKKLKENKIIPNYEEFVAKGHPRGFLSSSPKINSLFKENTIGIILTKIDLNLNFYY